MNSRSGVNENLVNFPADLTTLNQIEAKDGLLSFSFDHIYACHSENAERRPALQLDKEVEISSQCVVTEEEEVSASASAEVSSLADKLAAVESQNQKLKELVISHLDLIQQQNDALIKKEKLFQLLKQENETLKSRLNRMDRRVTLNQRNITQASANAESAGRQTSVKSEPSSSNQIMLNSLSELLIADNKSNSFLFESGDINKTHDFGQDQYNLEKNAEKDVSSFMPKEIGTQSSLNYKNLESQDFNMIESKRSYVKKEMNTENRTEPLYSITGTSANPVIQRIQRNRRRTPSGTSLLNRASKSPGVKMEISETASNAYDEDKNFDRNYTVNKKSKMINTYGKSSRNGNPPKKILNYTGSLSDRLKLIDTTPTGEDPYQLGEADMREQSPIPKLMLQKKSQNRMKFYSTDPSSTVTSRRIYEPDSTDINKIKLNRYNLTNTYMHPSEIKKEEPDYNDQDGTEPDLDLIKTEPEIDWRLYSKSGTATSLCDFSYGETPSNLASQMLPSLDSVEFHDLFGTKSPTFQGANQSYNMLNETKSNNINSRGRAESLVSPSNVQDGNVGRPQDKRGGRKRAFSTTGLLKAIKRENTPKTTGPAKPKLVKGKAACRGKKTPLPGMETDIPYHTLVGDPDVSWYLGLDPEIKPEDVEQPGAASLESTVEVPRWREKPYTVSYSLEGTENLDDKVFEKRHQKLEAEERRQLRWHMRRIREQRHVERLRQRQRDSWTAGQLPPSTFTVWPQPQRDLRFIEITDTLPVTAFGEAMPDMPQTNFVLPWVRTSRAMKRSKRSKTLL